MKCNSKNFCAGYYGKTLYVKLTNSCNANCSFCIEKDGYCPKSVDVDKLIESTINLENYPNVLILGGKPLLSNELEKYISGIRDYKEKIYITTNGSLLDTEKAYMLAEYVDAVNISIHHFSEYNNSVIYGHTDGDFVKFSTLRESIKILLQNNVPVRVNCNLVKGYMEIARDAKHMIDFCKNYLNVPELYFVELQNVDDELYVDARNIFDGIPDNPYSYGCVQDIEGIDGIKVRCKITCGRINERKRTEPIEEYFGSDNENDVMKVLYPSAEVKQNWEKNENIEYDCRNLNYRRC